MSDQNPVFIPGPTNIPDRLRHAMMVQTRDHRAPDFVETFAPVLEDTKRVFGTTSGRVITFPSSGTGGWEAAISNTLSPGDSVLVARYGMFSHRWIDMCQRHGLDVQIIECDWGTGAPAALFAAALSADKARKIKAVLVTHNETATGVVSDIAVAGSQKGFMLATGMAILGVSEKALDHMESAKLPRTFFDFRDMMAANAKGGFPYTPPLQLIYGMRESLKMLFEEGLDNVYARHTRLAGGVRAAVKAWGMDLVAQSPELYSDTVSAIYVPRGFDSNTLTAHAFSAYDLSFGVGLGQMNGKAFRIGHLGMLTDVMVLSGLAGIEMAMADLDYPITLGAGVTAAQDHFRATRTVSLQSAA